MANLFLHKQSVTIVRNEIKEERKNMNYIFIGDTSGSMYDVLDDLRKDLNNKIRNVIQDGDTITLARFSGEGDFSYFTVGFRKMLDSDFNTIEKKLKDNLYARGCTCFSEVLAKVPSIIDEVKTNYEGEFALIFLTDGQPVVSNYKREHENIIKALTAIREKVVSSIIVGYNDYYSRDLLGEMANVIEGKYIHSKEFSDFALSSNEYINSLNNLASIVEVKSQAPIYGNIAYSFNIVNGETVIEKFKNENGLVKVLVSNDEDKKDFFFFSEQKEGSISFDKNNEEVVKSYLIGSVLFSKSIQQDVALELVQEVGDIRLIQQGFNALTTPEFARFEESVVKAMNDSKYRYISGFKQGYGPNPNAFCVVEVLEALAKDKESKFYPYHNDFSYTHIAKRREEEIDIEDTVFFTVDGKKLKGVVSNVSDNGSELTVIANGTKYVIDTKDASKLSLFSADNEGFSIDLLAWNEKRLNLSAQVTITGHVTFKNEKYKNIPSLAHTNGTFPTFRFKRYAIIGDGIVNVAKLPVSLSKETFDLLQKNEVIPADTKYVAGEVVTLNLSELPVVNKSISSFELDIKDVCDIAQTIEENGASLKVFKELLARLYDKKEEEKKLFTEIYGVDGEEYLKQHFVEKGGYKPLSKAVEATDLRLVREFEIKIKGYTLPKVVDIEAKLGTDTSTKAFVKESEKKMAEALIEYNKFVSTQSKDVDKSVLITWLNERIDQLKKDKFALSCKLNRMKFAIILGRKWFKGYQDRDPISLDRNGLTFNIELKEVEEKI